MAENIQDEFGETPADLAAEEPLPSEQTEPVAERQASDEETLSSEEQGYQVEFIAANQENMLPPEAQGEAHGGPLGCCLGTMVGLMLSLSLAILSRAYASELGNILQGNYGLLGLLVRTLMGIMALALAIFFGYTGWQLGKRFFREYEPPQIKKRKSRVRARRSQQGVS
ncbi:MAG TPA: hypothetical protein VGD98_11925 [Ktedonobacteraceae bacterium]